MEKRYRSFTGYFIKTYGTRLQKVVVDAGFSCPNRDGTVATGGCTYCDNRAFHPGYSTPDKSITQQIDEGIEFHRVRYRKATQFLAYFQPYSNTHAPLEKLREIYRPALEDPRIAGIAIGTRPDCMDADKLAYFAQLAYGEPASARKIVLLEYGLESCYNRTLTRINRGHTWEQSVATILATAHYKLPICAHLIFGLPGESREDMLHAADLVSALPITSLKLHQLQLVKGTRMETEFIQHRSDFVTFTLEEYLNFIVDFLERLRPDIYIERIVGEVPPRFVNETPWGLIRNVEILRKLDVLLEQRDTFQGRLYANSASSKSSPEDATCNKAAVRGSIIPLDTIC